jgi:hypothetical protein
MRESLDNEFNFFFRILYYYYYYEYHLNSLALCGEVIKSFYFGNLWAYNYKKNLMR